jgi:hypothetical protein
MIRKLLVSVAFCGVMGGALMAEGKPDSHVKSVPELDGSIAGVAIALIGGGLAMAHSRRRRARR